MREESDNEQELEPDESSSEFEFEHMTLPDPCSHTISIIDLY